MTLQEQDCVTMTAQETALSRQVIETNLDHLDDWQLVESESGYQLSRTFEFPTFEEVMHFIREIGRSAHEQGHFPSLTLGAQTVRVTWWSPSINGLHHNDFIMAARTDHIRENWEIISGQRDAIEEASDESFPASDAPAW